MSRANMCILRAGGSCCAGRSEAASAAPRAADDRNMIYGARRSTQGCHKNCTKGSLTMTPRALQWGKCSRVSVESAVVSPGANEFTFVNVIPVIMRLVSAAGGLWSPYRAWSETPVLRKSTPVRIGFKSRRYSPLIRKYRGLTEGTSK
ncbi:unnamed protein product, partial [Iphiclides podalirius]